MRRIETVSQSSIWPFVGRRSGVLGEPGATTCLALDDGADRLGVDLLYNCLERVLDGADDAGEPGETNVDPHSDRHPVKVAVGPVAVEPYSARWVNVAFLSSRIDLAIHKCYIMFHWTLLHIVDTLLSYTDMVSYGVSWTTYSLTHQVVCTCLHESWN